MDDSETENLIDKKIEEATKFSKRKVGDTPTDDNQLVPKGYLDDQVTSVLTIVSASLVGLSTSILSGNATFTSTSVIGVALGFRPKQVTVYAVGGDSTGGWVSFSNGNWNSVIGNLCVYQLIASDGSGFQQGSEGNAWHTGKTTNTHTGIVTAITGTGFQLSNTKTSSPSQVVLLWVAEGN